MARIKGALMTRKRRKKIIGLARGYWGTKSTHYKVANQQVMKSLKYAYISRRLKKRDFRKLWISRISAACKANGINYSRFMNGLKKANVVLNRKVLADIAHTDPAGFAKLVETAKAAL
ncbi:MAG: 50S ribosomal protein L20 [Clostridia bacterium]|nr:50S ribosomal protein L20 [Oscillospiraceae bacterium]MBQ1955721.1 50S ribosomal protein L20 [Clostridia bacterium]